MEVLELKPITNKKITIYLIDKIRINPELNDIDLLKELVNRTDISFITVEMNNENFKEFKNSNLSIIISALNLEYHLLDIPEYAYGYLFILTRRTLYRSSAIISDINDLSTITLTSLHSVNGCHISGILSSMGRNRTSIKYTSVI